MGWVETVLGVFGVLATALGVCLLFAPGLLGAGPVGNLTGVVAEAGSTQLLLVLGFLTAVLVGVAAWPGSRPAGTAETERFAEAGNRRTAPDGGAGGFVGADVETAIREGGGDWRRVQTTLVDTAISTYAQHEGVSRSKATAAIEQGRWTDDALAAGVVGGEPPRRARLRMWLAPRRERRRRIERTTAALERLRKQ